MPAGEKLSRSARFGHSTSARSSLTFDAAHLLFELAWPRYGRYQNYTEISNVKRGETGSSASTEILVGAVFRGVSCLGYS